MLLLVSTVIAKGKARIARLLTWAYKSLFFATDPVSLDWIGWEIVDAKRKQMGLPPAAQTGRSGNPPNPREGFDIRVYVASRP